MVEAPIWSHVPCKPPEPGRGSHTSEAWAALRCSKDFQNFYKPLAGTAIHEAWLFTGVLSLLTLSM